MAVGKKRPLYPRSIIFSVLALMILGLSGCGVTPYSSKYACPPGYSGVCESMEDAYQDSVNGIDPRKFDKKYMKGRKKWEKKHADLVAARKKAEEARENVRGEAPGYRESLFHELRSLIQEPETPVVVPPRIMRGLVLGVAEKKVFVSPHYVFFMLDEPRWTLKKVPEAYVPSEPEKGLSVNGTQKQGE